MRSRVLEALALVALLSLAPLFVWDATMRGKVDHHPPRAEQTLEQASREPGSEAPPDSPSPQPVKSAPALAERAKAAPRGPAIAGTEKAAPRKTTVPSEVEVPQQEELLAARVRLATENLNGAKSQLSLARASLELRRMESGMGYARAKAEYEYARSRLVTAKNAMVGAKAQSDGAVRRAAKNLALARERFDALARGAAPGEAKEGHWAIMEEGTRDEAIRVAQEQVRQAELALAQVRAAASGGELLVKEYDTARELFRDADAALALANRRKADLEKMERDVEELQKQVREAEVALSAAAGVKSPPSPGAGKAGKEAP